MNSPNSGDWNTCNEGLPTGEIAEIPCLVTCQEWDIFNGDWGRKEIRIISYSTKLNEWNTKSDLKIEAWMYLPKPYGT